VLDRKMVVGVLSQRDLYFIEALPGVEEGEVSVEEAMTAAPYVVDPGASLERVAREMAKHKYGCAVVAEKGEVVGLFTTTDALSVLADLLVERRRAPTRARSVRS
jgi:acetoin utilization protein AcuB